MSSPADSQLWLGAAEKSTEARFTADSSEWFTPVAIIEAARETMGAIDFDPASCATANRNVRAPSICSIESGRDGLVEKWVGNVFCNPPSPPKPWWQRLMSQCPNSGCPQAIFVAYSIECLQQSSGWGMSMLRFPICVPNQRVRYLCTAPDRASAIRRTLAKRARKSPPVGPTKAELRYLDELDAMAPDALVEGETPTHSSAIVGVGVRIDRFRGAFEKIGEVCGG